MGFETSYINNKGLAFYSITLPILITIIVHILNFS